MKIVSRSEWGAAPPRHRKLVNWPPGVTLWVHHTAGPPDQTVKKIQEFHQGPSRGWSDIGYGYLVDETGKVYEGRGFEVDAAHSPGKNHEPSVSLIGNYEDHEPTDAQHRSVYDLRTFLDAGELCGHRENTGGTACPGDGAMAKIVNGPPPKGAADDAPLYYFEELPHDQDGLGPVKVGQAAGYSNPAIARAVATSQRAMGRSVSTVREGDDEEARTYVLWWAKGTYGLAYRFGPWRSEDAREANRTKRQTNTGRILRRFEGRSHSLYPYPS